MVQNNLVTLFSSYDVFGKSIPGAVFFLGLVSILPEESKILAELTSWPGGPGSSFVAILLLALGLGLIFGEAIHTLANISEKMVAWLGRRAVNSAGFLRDNLPELHTALTTDFTDYADATKFEAGIYDRIEDTKKWYKKRYYGLNASFKSHRRLFAEQCATNFGSKRGPRKNLDPKKIYSQFFNKFEEVFDSSLPKTNIQELMELYPLITAEVTKSGGSEFRRFQSVYSFCRSMWVTLSIFSTAHLLIFFGNSREWITLFDYRPAVFILVPVEFMQTVPIALFLSSILFVVASGTYKKHYVEYLVAEFSLYATSDSNESNQTNSPDHNQSSLSDDF